VETVEAWQIRGELDEVGVTLTTGARIAHQALEAPAWSGIHSLAAGSLVGEREEGLAI
jgi:hypothetical protein